MLHHVSIGVRDVASAASFYDRVLGVLGYRRVLEVLPYGIGYGDQVPAFWVQLPHDHSPATVGNGVHVAFMASSEAAIEEFHRVALAAGATDEGAPGPRPDYGPGYFGAFVRDPNGHKLEAVLVAAPPAPSVKSAKKKRAGKGRPAARRNATKKTPKRRKVQRRNKNRRR
jgi:catechol 2,3-dioxygenase-like lactoylglutathione lyase family enzyme